MTALLRRIFLDNLVLKLLAFALAMTLVLVKREDQTTVVTASARVRVTHPENRVLVSPLVDKVNITIEGKYSRLRKFESDNLAGVDVNLSGYEEGQVTFDPEFFKLPPDLKVADVRPAAMLVKFENRVQRTVPVVPQLEGEPQTGYRVGQVTVEPVSVTVEGAESVVKALEQVRTERISLVGRNQTTTLSVPLESAPAYASYRERGRRYEATVVIEEKRSSKVISGVLVEVREVPVDVPGFEVSPAVVDVALDGPVTQLAELEAEEMVAYVSAADLGPENLHTRMVEVEPIAGLTVTDIKPNRVTLVRLPAPPPVPDGDGGADEAAGVDAPKPGQQKPGQQKPDPKNAPKTAPKPVPKKKAKP